MEPLSKKTVKCAKSKLGFLADVATEDVNQALPIDLQLLACTFLSVSDHLCRLAVVSKHTRWLSTRPASWCPKLELEDYWFHRRLNDERFSRVFGQVRPRELSLICNVTLEPTPEEAAPSDKLTLAGAAAVLKNMPTLTALGIDILVDEVASPGAEDLSLRRVEKAITQIPTERLRKVTFSGPWSSVLSDWLVSARETLTTLYICTDMSYRRTPTGIPSFDFLPRLSNLAEFACMIDDASQLREAAACPALTELDLSYARHLTMADLACLDLHAPSLGRLTTIIIKGAKHLGAPCLAHLRHLKGLRTLYCDADEYGSIGTWLFSEDLAHVSHLPLTDLELGFDMEPTAVLRRLPLTLTRLGLRCGATPQAQIFSDQGLFSFLQRQSAAEPGGGARLTRLDLIADSITKDVLEKLLSLAPGLQRISTNSANLSAEYQAAFRQAHPQVVLLLRDE